MNSESEQALRFMFDLLEKVRGFTFTVEPISNTQETIRLRSADPIPFLKPGQPYLACRIEEGDWYIYFDIDADYRLVILSDKSALLALVKRLDLKLDLTAWDTAVELAETNLVKMREMKQELEQYK